MFLVKRQQLKKKVRYKIFIRSSELTAHHSFDHLKRRCTNYKLGTTNFSYVVGQFVNCWQRPETLTRMGLSKIEWLHGGRCQLYGCFSACERSMYVFLLPWTVPSSCVKLSWAGHRHSHELPMHFFFFHGRDNRTLADPRTRCRSLAKSKAWANPATGLVRSIGSAGRCCLCAGGGVS